MNVAYYTEYKKIGLFLPSNERFLYSKLKCFNSNVHRMQMHELSCPIYSVRFCKVQSSCHLLAAVNEDGIVALHDTRPNRKLNPVDIFKAHNNAIFDLVWLENVVRLVTASGDHSAVVFDFGQGRATPIVRLAGHQGSVKAIACKPGDAHIITTGSRDGNIMQWDIRTNYNTLSHDSSTPMIVKADNIIKCSHLKSRCEGTSRFKCTEKGLENSQCISSVVYQDEKTIISCSSTDKCIKIWDMRKTYSAFKGIPIPMHKLTREFTCENRAGYSSLAVSPCGLKLYAYCLDGKIYSYNLGTYNSKPQAIYQGPGATSYFCKVNVSPDGKYISSGSADNHGFIWSVDFPSAHLVSLQGHTAEVTSVDWCKYGELRLASCSDDGTYRVWNVRMDIEKENELLISGIAIPQLCRSLNKTYLTPYFANHSIKEPLRPTLPPKSCFTPKKLQAALSELPNYVIDGCSPHNSNRKICNSSPADTDWLSIFIASTPPAAEKCSATNAKKQRRTPNTSRKSARGSLLKYFKRDNSTC